MKWMVFIFLSLMVVSCSSADEKVEYWKTELNTSLDKDSTRQDIEAYLENSGLDYGYIERTKTFVALDRNVENYIVVTYSVGINIELDENEKLQRIKVYKTD
ncbi:hypothetical protein [Kaarinaea lacus]